MELASEGCLELTGYSSAELTENRKLSFGDLVHPDDRRPLWDKCQRNLAARRTCSNEYRISTAEGGEKWVWDQARGVYSVSGELVAVEGFVSDITGRKRAEEQLIGTEALLRRMAETSPLAFLVVDSRTDAIRYFNERFVEVWGLARLEAAMRDGSAKGTGVLAATLDGVRGAQPLAASYLSLSSEDVRSTIEDEIELADGRVIRRFSTQIRDRDDRFFGRLYLFEDLSGRKQMQARMLQTDRLATAGTLAASVAHEINNPLAYIALNLQLLAKDVQRLAALHVPADRGPGADGAGLAGTAASPPKPRYGSSGSGVGAPLAFANGLLAEILAKLERMHASIAYAQEGTERVRVIVNDLRTFARRDDERRGPVDVRRVLDSAAAMAFNEIRHRAQLVKEFDDIAPVIANEGRLGQVFLNLLVNAAQAIPEGQAEQNFIRVGARLDGAGRVVVEVSDTGSGIAPENLGRLFDPFFTTKPVGVGTGLGLAICHGIVTGLGGEIDVESELGKGSTFRVALPAAEGTRPRAPSPPPAAAPARDARHGLVLVVDDEQLIVDSIEDALSEEHEVVALTKGREAVRRIAAGERFDVILCDLMMPDLSGMDLYAQLVEVAPDQAEKIIFLTAGAFTARARAFLETSTNPVLEKPFDVQVLARLVRERLLA